jgi:hypothetical protein
MCGTMIGKNLLGERPFALAGEHVEEHDLHEIMRAALNIAEKRRAE